MRAIFTCSLYIHILTLVIYTCIHSLHTFTHDKSEGEDKLHKAPPLYLTSESFPLPSEAVMDAATLTHVEMWS